jgi:hypothetical protein
LQQGQQLQLKDGNNAIAMRATMPLQIKGNNTIVTRTTTPAWQQQGHLHIDNGNNTIVMMPTIAIATMAKMPAHQRQRRHCNKGNSSGKGNNASSTMMEMLVHWQQQQCHLDESDNHHCHNGKDAWASTATMPSQQRQWCQLDDNQQGQQS